MTQTLIRQEGHGGEYVTDAHPSLFPANGTTDERSAFNTFISATMPATGGRLVLGLGTHLIGDDITIDKDFDFAEGSILKPANGKTITIRSIPVEQINHQIFDLSAGGAVSFPTRHEVNALWFGMPRNTSDDCGPHMQALLDAGYRNIYVPPGAYAIKTTVTGLDQVYIRGGGGDSHYQGGVRFTGAVADLGAGGVMFQATATGGGNVQTFTFEGITFRGDNAAGLVFNNLNGSDAGVVAVDAAGVKEGGHFVRCAFTHVKRGVATIETVNYTASLYFSHCRFQLCYRGIDATTTTPISVVNSCFESCADWISGTRVAVFGSEFNNADNSPESYCAISATALVTVIGCWIEGGDRQIAIRSSGGVLTAIGNRMSGANNATSFKYHFHFTEGCKLHIVGNQLAENTRIARWTPTSNFDWSGVSIFMQANNIPTYEWSNDDSTTPPTHCPNFVDMDGEGGLNSITFDTGTAHRSPAANMTDYTVTIANSSATTTRPQFATFQLLGFDNGSGGSNTYSARFQVVKGFDGNWSIIDAPTSWTVTLENASQSGVDVVIVDNHAGTADADRVWVVDHSSSLSFTFP